MIGRDRPLSRYATPRSRMNAVGECVGRFPFGRSAPRAARPPPITSTFGDTALIAS